MIETYDGRITPGQIVTATVDAPDSTQCGTFHCTAPATYLWLDLTPMCEDCYHESEWAMMCEDCNELSGQTTHHGWECSICHATWIAC